jgi:predicted HicB family RNase H-like nuclease|tara:strand:+ start:381 stop:530 length:150 start_codon:yes stop_codon:yes gene_type:complete
MEKRKEKRLMVHVYLTDEEKKRIALQAQQIGISVSSYIKIKLFMKNDRE